MLFVNRQNRARVLQATAKLLGLRREKLLTKEECAVLDGKREPHGIAI